MSADRYSPCPVCATILHNDIIRLQAELTGQYGKLPLSQWEEKRRIIEDLKTRQNNMPLTMREDWEVSMEGSMGKLGFPEVHFTYSCSCQKCKTQSKIYRFFREKDMKEET